MDIKIRSSQLNKYHHFVGIYHENVAEIQQHAKPIKSTHAAYVATLVKRHDLLLKKTLNKPMRSNIVTGVDKAIISKKKWQDLMFMNPHRIIPCQEATLRAIEAYEIPLGWMSAFTVIHGEHETSDTLFDKASGQHLDRFLKNIIRKFHDGLRDYNYLGVVEFAIFPNEKYEDKEHPKRNGILIAPHLQGLIWKEGGLTKQDTKAFKGKFSGGRWNATGFKHTPVWDVAGAAAYMHKLPLFVYKYAKDKSYRHTSAPISQDLVFTMFQRLKHIRFEELFVCGGEGKKMKTVILNYLRDYYQPY